MVMSSHQITSMAMQQQAYFGNAANYAQQISPVMGGVPRSYTGGYSMGPPPVPPPGGPMMPGYSMGAQGGLGAMGLGAMYGLPGQHMAQGFGEQLAGTGIGGLSSMMGGISSAANYATMGGAVATMGAGAWGLAAGIGFGGGVAGLAALPMGGALVAAGSLPAFAAAGGLALGAWGAGQVAAGFDERQSVGRVMRNRFGGAQGVGGGRGGMGFNSSEIGGMSTMMREMAGNDMFTQFDELTRVLDRTSQMGLYRGVQGARKFRERFRELTSSLKEIAEVMNTSLEGATALMDSQRHMGFFSGKEISSSLARTQLNAGASGMSTGQLNQIGMQGSQMGRMMGMYGSSGATAMREMAAMSGVGMQTGVLSDRMVAEATGGAMGAEGAQILAGRAMQMGGRFFSRGAGRPMLAGLWDPNTGGINAEALNQAATGQLSFREARSMGRSNIAGSGGYNSEFFSQQERIMGELMSSGQGMNAMMGMMEQHYARRGVSLDDPAMQRSLRRRFGMSQSEVELRIQEYRNAPQMMDERKARFRQQIQNTARIRARERSGFSGFRRRFHQSWDREVEGPLRQLGDDMTTDISKSIEQMVDEFEGVITTHMTEAGRAAYTELATGKSGAGDAARYRSATALRNRLSTGAAGGGGGFLRGLGAASGLGTPGVRGQLQSVGITPRAGASIDDMVSQLRTANEQLNVTQEDLGLSSDQFRDLSRAASMAVTQGGREAGISEQSFGERWFTGGHSGDVDAMKQRVAYLSKDARFSGLLAGKSPQQQAGVVNLLTRELSGSSYEISSFGGGSSAALFGRSVSELRKYRGGLEASLTERLSGQASATERGLGFALRWGTGLMVGGPNPLAVNKVAGLVGKAQSRWLGADVKGLMGKVGGDREFSRYMRAAVGEEVSGLSQSDAAHRLKIMANSPEAFSSGALSGIDLDRRERAALGRIVTSKDKETQDEVKGIIEAQLAVQGAIGGKRDQDAAADLSSYIEQHHNRFEGNVSSGILGKFKSLVNLRAGNSNPEEVRAKELALYQELYSSKDGADMDNLIGVLEQDKGGAGAYTAIGLRRMKRFVGGYENLYGSARSRALLGKTMSQLGVDVEKAFGRGRRGMLNTATGREWTRALERGDKTGADLQRFLSEKGALGSLAEGVLTTDVTRNLGDVSSLVGGGVTQEELVQRGSELAQAERVNRVAGGPAEQSLSSLAQRQVDHLSHLVKLTSAIAAKSGVDIAAIPGGNKGGGSSPSPPPVGQGTVLADTE